MTKNQYNQHSKSKCDYGRETWKNSVDESLKIFLEYT